MSKHKAIPKRIRQQLYEQYNHRCAYCGCDLEYKDMQVDHIKPVYVHNDIGHDMTESEMYDISNLLPPCRQCNFYKDTFSLGTFRKRLQTVMMDNLRKGFTYRLAAKYGLIKEQKREITFYFERLQSDRDPVNMFEQQMTEDEQLELSEALDDFIQMYENRFEDQTNDEETREILMDEFEHLYDLVYLLNKKEIERK